MTPYYLWQMIHTSNDVLPSRQQPLCPLQTAHYARCDAFQALPSLQILEDHKVHKIRKITPCIIFLPSKKCRISQITLFKRLFFAKNASQNGKTTKTLFESLFFAKKHFSKSFFRNIFTGVYHKFCELCHTIWIFHKKCLILQTIAILHVILQHYYPFINSNPNTITNNMKNFTKTAITALSLCFAYAINTNAQTAPQAASQVVAKYDPASCTSTITWTAPTKGQDGTDLGNDVTYSIRRKGNSEPLATGLTTTSYVDEVNMEGQANSAYYVTAQTATGKSSETKSNDIIIGRPYEMPFAESAPGGELTNCWQITRSGSSRWGASDLGSMAYDNDRGYITFCPLTSYDQSTITSGYIHVGEAAAPTLKFHYFYVFPRADEFSVSVSVDGGDPVEVWSYDYENFDNIEHWVDVELKLADIIGDGKYIQVSFSTMMSEAQMSILYLDDITLIDRCENDLKATLIKAPANLKPGEDRSATVRLDNLGSTDYAGGSYTIKAMVDGQCMTEMEGPRLKAGKRVEVNIDDICLSVFHQGTSADLCFALDVDDENADNNTTDVVTLEVKPSLLAVPTGLTAEEGENPVLNWEAPVVEKVTSTTVTESFETAPSFTIDDFGEWAMYDGLNTSVYGLSTADEDISFPNTCAPQAWTVFDYSYSDFFDSLKPNSGDKMMAAFSHAGSAADSWLISPELSGEEQIISFYAKAAASSYRETFEILYSTSANRALSTFKVLEDSKTTAKASWTSHKYELPEGTRYFAIHCISNDALCLLVDDVTYVPEAQGQPCERVKGYNVYRNGECINDALLRTTTFTDKADGTATYNVTAVYASGESLPSADAKLVASGIQSIVNGTVKAPSFTTDGRRAAKNYRGIVISKEKKTLK